VVTTAGTTVQVLNGLVAVAPGGVAFHAGTWVDMNPGYSRAHGNITAVNEFDYFFGVDYDILPKLNVGAEYSEFISGQPSVAFKNEHNLEFSVKYKDGSPDKPYSINPYAKLFWAFSSRSSTVVLGKAGKTFDIELGAVPTYKTGMLTLSAPTWITVGPKTYWGVAAPDGNVGVFSTGLKASVPVPFKPGGAGMSVYAFGQYYNLINDNLVTAKALLNGGASKRSHFQFGGGINFGF